jgi:hypothetical protein
MTTRLIDLRAEAAAEVRRLTSARVFTRDADQGAVAHLEGDGPWITRARRPAQRRFLGRRLMLIWRVAYEDVCGARTESRLVPVVIELSAAPGPRNVGARAFASSAHWESSSELRGLADQPPPRRRRSAEASAKAEPPEARRRQARVGTVRKASWLTALLSHVDSDVRARIDADSLEWQATVERVVRSFASTRISRERAIAVWLARTDRTAFQPGLFDRRAERAQRVHAAATAESDRITADRLATSERFSALARRPAQLLLVLAP